MRVFAAIICLVALSFTLFGCYPGDAELYESNFDEFDISGRINDVAYAIENDSVTPRTIREISVIIEDLRSIDLHNNSTLNIIHEKYIDSANNLLRAATARSEGSEDYAKYYEHARELYKSADDILAQYKKNEDI